MAVVAACLVLWCSACTGQILLRPFWPSGIQPEFRAVYGAALGLAAAAYGVFLLGILHLLYKPTVAIWWLLFALIGLPEMKALVKLLTTAVINTREIFLQFKQNKTQTVCLCLMVVVLALGVLACYRWPGAIEWDALSYHLADPAVYIRMHAIKILPAEHHSNFPFTMEMLYTTALLCNSFALANLFHFITCLLTLSTLYLFGKKWFHPLAGMLAASLFLATPLVLWEATTSYIDVAGGLYATLAIAAALELVYYNEETRINWAAAAGAMAGVALGIKYLALIPAGLVLFYLIWKKTGSRNVLAYLACAVIIASPWYLKNIIWMHNPFYPFYYKLFPNSKYWSLHRAVVYQSEQNSFGAYHGVKHWRATLLNILLAPWQILSQGQLYYNRGEYNFAALTGGLYTAFAGLFLMLRKKERVVSDVWLFVLIQAVLWFFLAQIGRYLLQFLPLAALLCGYTAWRLRMQATQNQGNTAHLVATIAASLPAAGLLLLLTSIVAMPPESTQALLFEQKTGLLPTVLSLQEISSVIGSSGNQKAHLENTLDVYNAERWLNHHTPVDAGVIIYDDTRGLYLQRPYMWGDGEHSAYIPYRKLQDPAQLTSWFLRHGFKYALFNLNWNPQNNHTQPVQADNAFDLLVQWYTQNPSKLAPWRKVVGEALSQSLWKPIHIRHGCVVVEFTERGGA